MSGKDLYPLETGSFNALPRDSPLLHLDYGGILTTISEHVRDERKKTRDQRREFLIMKINNINLNTLVRDIQVEAKLLESYVRKEWTKGPVNKKNLFKFFESHDISLKYLEDVYSVQCKGAPTVNYLDIIKLSDDSYGLVTNTNYKTSIKYVSIVEDGNDFYMPYRCRFNDGYTTYPHSINVWKCNVVSHMTHANLLKYNEVINDYNKEMALRRKFWFENPTLNAYQSPYEYFHYKYDVMNGEIPPPSIYNHRENELWNLFKWCIDEEIRKRIRDETRSREQNETNDNNIIVYPRGIYPVTPGPDIDVTDTTS